MLSPSSPVLSQLRDTILEVAGEDFEVILSDFLSEVDPKGLKPNRIFFSVTDFTRVKSNTTREVTSSVMVTKDTFSNCRVKLDIYGEAIKVMEAIHKIRNYFMFHDFMAERIPHLVINRVKEFKSLPVTMGNQSLTYQRIYFDSVLSEEITYEHGSAIETVDYEFQT